MKSTSKFQFNPRLDLKLERVVNVPREQIWRGWTEPELLKKWFCPKPWFVSQAEIDLRPGGLFKTVMNGPNGEEVTNAGCFLEIIPNEKLVWTDALVSGFRPSEKSFLTGVLLLEDNPGGGTKYTAYGLHKNVDDRKQHEEMGFEKGWATALEQLVSLLKSK